MEQADPENQQQTRVALKSFRMIDPELGQGGQKNQRRDPDLFERLRERVGINQAREAKEEHSADDHFPNGPILERLDQLAFRASPALFGRSETFLHETLALKEPEHRQGKSHVRDAKINV